MPRAQSFDVAVIGGGAAGCVVARRLAEAGDRRVILIEAGPDVRGRTPRAWRDGWTLPKVPDWGFISEPGPDGETGPLRRGRVLGGTSWLTRFAVRGAAADFDAWAARGIPGWAYADVLPTFRRVEADAEFGGEPWHGDAGPIPITRYPGVQPSPVHESTLAALDAAGVPACADHNAPDAEGVGRMPMSSRGAGRVTSADAYLSRRTSPPSLTVRPDSLVGSIEIQAGRAVGVRLADRTRIRAGRIVLAAGTYGSPAILMRSGVGPSDLLHQLKIHVRLDLPGVGANLADHPAVEVDTGSRGARTRAPVIHSIATFRSGARRSTGAPDLMLWFSDPADVVDPFTLEAVLMKPASRGSVRLRSADPGDAPRIRLPEFGEQADRERLVEATRFAFEIARRPEMRPHATGRPPREPATRRSWNRYLAEHAYSIPHVVGTCAMGPATDRDAVVDPDGSVHGVEGLSVMDASVIPDATAGFPHLVTLMLAEHLAERFVRAG